MNLNVNNVTMFSDCFMGIAEVSAEYKLTPAAGKPVYIDADWCSEGGVEYRVTRSPLEDLKKKEDFEGGCIERYSSLKKAAVSKYFDYFLALDKIVDDKVEEKYGSRLDEVDRNPFGFERDEEEEDADEDVTASEPTGDVTPASVKAVERIHVRVDFVQIGCSCMGQHLVAAYRTLKNEADGSTFCMMIRWNGHEDRPACFSVQKSDELMHLFFEDGVYDWERECELNEHGDIELPPEVIASPTYQRVYNQLISSMDKKLQSLGYKLEDDFSVVEA